MPKILIKEFDKTDAGTPDSYENYSVLITGYRSKAYSEDDEIQPDFNGVYEFRSADDFAKIIGSVDPMQTIKYDEENNKTRVEYHYGNKMAYELLKLGYPVIYKAIDSIFEMCDEDFWEIFKDKASYDFRFISHGLLASTPATDVEQAEAKAKQSMAALTDEYELITSTINKLEEIRAEAKAAYEAQEGDKELEVLDFCEQTYVDLDKSNFPGLIKDAVKGTYYESFSEADVSVASRKSVLEDELADLTAELAEIKANLENNYFSTTKINKVNGYIANLASYSENAPTGRGDCVALLELDENTYKDMSSKAAIAKIIESIGVLSTEAAITVNNGKYCALTVPSVDYESIGRFPAAFHYLACFKNALDLGFNEWYAAAGYTRGVASKAIKSTTVKLGEIAINALEPRVSGDDAPVFACNVIANFRGSYYLWGNRTVHPLDTKGLVASHFLNIRQLCTTIKKQLYIACRRFTFDPNSDTLWFNFVGAIRPTLDAMKADQGIRDYKIIKEAAKEKATLKAKIRIIPIEAVEDFDIDVYLEDEFGETSINTVE